MSRRISASPGQRFDRLEVIREVEPTKGKRRVLCQCKCGEQPIVDLYKLVEGRTKSCGCLSRENLELGRQAEDLTNRTFGRLTARSRVGTKNGSPLWQCFCACGNTTSVTARDLMHGNTLSCGCLKQAFAQTLKEHNADRHTVDGVFVPLLRQKVQHNSTTGVKGVSVHRDKRGRLSYMANITIKGKRHYLGLYPTIDAAAEARRKAEQIYHKPYLEADDHDQ